MDDRQKILSYRESLRAKVARLCRNLIRETHGGRRPLPDISAGELMFQLHTAQQTLLEYTQAVVQDHRLYTEDTHYVAEQMVAAFRAYEVANGAIKAAEMRQSLRAKELREAVTA